MMSRVLARISGKAAKLQQSDLVSVMQILDLTFAVVISSNRSIIFDETRFWSYSRVTNCLKS